MESSAISLIFLDSYCCYDVGTGEGAEIPKAEKTYCSELWKGKRVTIPF